MKESPELLERKLEQRLLSLLEGIPGFGNEAKVCRNPAGSERIYDILGELRLPRSGDKVEFWVKCKNLPRPSQFPFASLQSKFFQNGSRETRVPVLAAPYISPRMAELCGEHDWSWYDLAGNCRLVVPGAVYIERTGNKPVHPSPKPKANLGTAASARVLLALLAPQNAETKWTQTLLQKSCEPGVSIGLVHKVVTYLREEAWLKQLEDGRFQVKDAMGLLELWRKAYRMGGHQKLGYFTLLKPRELNERLARLNDSTSGKVAYAAFSAADFQAPNVRQNKTWVYVNDAALDEFLEVTEAKRVESGENLVALIPEDDGVFSLGDAGQGERLICTHPVITWLDLQHLGGRGAEAAEAILNQCLKPAWEREPRRV